MKAFTIIPTLCFIDTGACTFRLFRGDDNYAMIFPKAENGIEEDESIEIIGDSGIIFTSSGVDVEIRRVDGYFYVNKFPPTVEELREQKRKAREIPKGLDGKPITPENYVELKGVTTFEHGDILASHLAGLGDPAAWQDVRKPMIINKSPFSELSIITDRARMLAKYESEGIEELVRQIYFEMMTLYPMHSADSRVISIANGQLESVGEKLATDGVCRHRAAAFQTALQATNDELARRHSPHYIYSRYQRVATWEEKFHAVVEVDLFGRDLYDFVIDPTLGFCGRVEVEESSLGESYLLSRYEFFRDQRGATVWRPRRKNFRLWLSSIF